MKTLSKTVTFDSQLIQKYNQPLPRYTSYPPATQLTTEFPLSHWEGAIASGNIQQRPISLYCHIPFCESACYFCGCNTIITQYKDAAIPYLKYLERNIEQVARVIDSNRKVNQMHWGGGTPNYLNLEQVEALWKKINQHFTFEDNAEISIEINPRYVDKNYILFLRDLGFNRISFGIQDFNPQVQEAINRVQPEAMLFDVMSWIRDANFESVNVDLIYGLPYQNLASYRHTINKTIELDPDRIAVFNFAYIPWLKPTQKRMPQSEFPSAEEKLDILQMAISELETSDYLFIGMDHFAKPNDELSIAQKEGKLHRNFQGYTTKPESELFGFGITSISMLHDVYIQNHKTLKEYYQAIDNDNLPIFQGVSLTKDDLLRRTVIMELMCQYQLSASELEEKYHLGFDFSFDDYFAQEIPQLKLLEADGLVQLIPDGIKVTPAGRLLIRNIAAVFDNYLQENTVNKFSQSV